MVKSIDEILQNTMKEKRIETIRFYEDDLSERYREYVKVFPSETLYKRLLRDYPQDVHLWISYARFSDKDKGREIFKQQREEFKGSKQEYIDLLVENAVFEE